eukprot:TRINITY_DN5282_c0_g1_i2.p1 TRINITY_DN5282_c0_g1~~TRINITY_DN5282_c0_g1_i2.p1  ORF type:complete len:869 (-),score=182.28 TRINITY_DN5282_c0_g1_i2:146-2728(-)
MAAIMPPEGGAGGGSVPGIEVLTPEVIAALAHQAMGVRFPSASVGRARAALSAAGSDTPPASAPAVAVVPSQRLIGRQTVALPDSHLSDVTKAMRQIHKRLDDANMRTIDFFRELETSGDGYLSAEEFRQGLEKLGFSIGPSELQHVVRVIDKDCDGTVGIKELDRVLKKAAREEVLDPRMVEMEPTVSQEPVQKQTLRTTKSNTTAHTTSAVPDSQLSDVTKALRQIHKQLDDENIRTIDFFRKLDTNGDGYLSPEELRQGLKNIGFDIEASEFQQAVQVLDVDRDGTVSIKELDRVLKRAGRGEELLDGYTPARQDANDSSIVDSMRLGAVDTPDFPWFAEAPPSAVVAEADLGIVEATADDEEELLAAAGVLEPHFADILTAVPATEAVTEAAVASDSHPQDSAGASTNGQLTSSTQATGGSVRVKGGLSDKARAVTDRLCQRSKAWGQKLRIQEQSLRKNEAPSTGMSAVSRRLASGMTPISERAEKICQDREEARVRARLEKEQKELENTPLHPAISQRAMRLNREVEDCWRWKEKRDQRIRAEQIAAHQKEQAECTFKPDLCKGSESMLKRQGFRPGPRGSPGAQSAPSTPGGGQEIDAWAEDSAARSMKSAPVSFDAFLKGAGQSSDVQRSGQGVTSPAGVKGSTNRRRSAEERQPPTPSSVPAVEVGGVIDFQSFLTKAGASEEFHIAEAPRRRAPQASAPPRIDSPSLTAAPSSPRRRTDSHRDSVEAPRQLESYEDSHCAPRASSPVLVDLRQLTGAFAAPDTDARSGPEDILERQTTRSHDSRNTAVGRTKLQGKFARRVAGVPSPALAQDTAKAKLSMARQKGGETSTVVPYSAEYDDILKMTEQFCR